MDNNLKEQIDNIFKTYGSEESNMIAIDMYGDTDYDSIAQSRCWDDYIGDFSNRQEIDRQDRAPKGFYKDAIFVNLGLDTEASDYDHEKEQQMINDIQYLCATIGKMVNWEESDFNGDVNQYWFAFVCVTRDYKVVEITSDYTSAIFYKVMADLTQMGSVDDEEEKLALTSIQDSVSSIMTEFKKVKSDEGKSKVYGMVEDLDRMISRG